MDDRCLAVNPVAAWNGQLIYLGRIDPYFAGGSGDRGTRADYSGSKSGRLASDHYRVVGALSNSAREGTSLSQQYHRGADIHLVVRKH